MGRLTSRPPRDRICPWARATRSSQLCLPWPLPANILSSCGTNDVRAMLDSDREPLALNPPGVRPLPAKAPLKHI